jgi:hypothetical protein
MWIHANDNLPYVEEKYWRGVTLAVWTLSIMSKRVWAEWLDGGLDFEIVTITTDCEATFADFKGLVEILVRFGWG